MLLAGTTGNRIGELFTLTDDRVDLTARTLTIPPELCKERRRKVIPITDEETQLLREHLLARAAGARFVFPKRHGSEWSYSAFRKLVWRPMIRAPGRRRRARGRPLSRLRDSPATTSATRPPA